MYLPLLALAIAAFGIGTTEFVIMGLLPEVADNLHISTAAAGSLVSGYAMGVAIGAPILAILTARWPRRFALLCLITMFTIGNILCALAPSYDLLMVARVATAFCHAAFFGIAAVVAADLVPREKRAQAMSLVFTGLTLANVLGVPFGTALGQWHGWRSTFWAVSLIGIVALVALNLLLPKKIRSVAGGNILHEFISLMNPQVQLALLISTLSSVSLFTVFTYIAYILRDVTGFSAAAESWVLLLFGGGITIGGLAGGRLADWKLLPSLTGLMIALAVILTGFAWTCHDKALTLITLAAWGMAAFAVTPAAQILVLDKAVRAPNLASTLNQGAFNVGNAVGAWLGGLVLGAGVSLDHLPLVGAAVAVLALLVVIAASILSGKMKVLEPLGRPVERPPIH